ncbi:MAG: Gfo/Idh/MocA family oxidoreductase [Thermomicrobiales bacterium]
MSAKYKVAIIGTGRMGGLIEDEIAVGSSSKPYGHFPAYAYIDDTEVVAVANRGEERLERFSKRFGITNTYLDYREMILKEQPDIVSITTPSLQRANPIIFCAENGVKAIYAEKGLSASLAEADAIAEAVRRNKVAFNGEHRGATTTPTGNSPPRSPAARSETAGGGDELCDRPDQASPAHDRPGTDDARRPGARLG